jgi:hypothetical protein
MEDSQSTRDLLVELKVTVEHLTRRVEDAFQRSDTRIERLEIQVRDDMKELEKRVRIIERYFWLAVGGLAILNILLPYIHDYLRGLR